MAFPVIIVEVEGGDGFAEIHVGFKILVDIPDVAPKPALRLHGARQDVVHEIIGHDALIASDHGGDDVETKINNRKLFCPF